MQSSCGCFIGGVRRVRAARRAARRSVGRGGWRCARVRGGGLGDRLVVRIEIEMQALHLSLGLWNGRRSTAQARATSCCCWRKGPRHARAPNARHVHRYSLSVARVAAASTDQSGDLPLAARIAPPHRSRERWITAMLRRSYCTVCSSGRRAAAAAARAACAALVVTTPSTLRACVCESRSSRTLSGCRRQRRRLAGRKAPSVYGCPEQPWVPWRCCSSLRLWRTAT